MLIIPMNVVLGSKATFMHEMREPIACRHDCRAKFHTWAVTYMMSPTLVGCAKARLSRDPVSKCPLRPMRLAAMYAHCSIHRITYNRIPSTQPETMTRQLKDGGA